ncbi:MAG: YbaN family protein [Alphaproteobacteria bacterium]|nr:YbaN family protein [Alphaproteobacteria bacterium]
MTEKHTPVALRPLYLALGWAFVALGAAGSVLPVLPTTPFLILAAMCFARSSPRLHGWLYNHPAFGATLRDWDRHRVIPLHAKVLSIGAMAASLAYIALVSPAPGYVVAGTAAVMGYGAWFVLSKPSRVPTGG